MKMEHSKKFKITFYNIQDKRYIICYNTNTIKRRKPKGYIMYYLVANKYVENNYKTTMHIYDISQFYGKILYSMQTLLEHDRKNGIENDYSIIETDGCEFCDKFCDKFFKTFSIKYERKIDITEKRDGKGEKCL